MDKRMTFLRHGARLSAVALLAGATALGCSNTESRHDRDMMGRSDQAYGQPYSSQARTGGADYGRTGGSGGAQAYGSNPQGYGTGSNTQGYGTSTQGYGTNTQGYGSGTYT